MWEAIQSNRRRSWLLVTVLAVVLIGFGTILGAAIDPRAAPLGALAALALWGILLLTAALGGDAILLGAAGAREVRSKEEFPRLWNVVEEMKIASGLPAMPRIFVVEDPSPNAFAVGIRPDRAAVAVTSGLLRRLNRDELQGVVAHEIGHIANRDVRFLVLAGVMVGAVVILADLFLRSLWYGGGVRRRSSGKSDPRVQAAILGAAILMAILAPLFAQILYFACSRRREYLADASSARFTRYPAGLASALGKIAGAVAPRRGAGHGAARSPGGKSRTMAPMYIINPLRARGSTGLFSTHPPTERRIRILEGMSGAHFDAYDKAYRKVIGRERGCLGDATLTEGRAPVAIREPTPEPESKGEAADRAREIAGFLGRIGGWAAFSCACGVGIRIPPDFKGDAVPCPRCGRKNPVPAAAEAKEAREAPLEYRRRGKGWESFRCRCGATIQLSPAHIAPSVTCPRCRRKIAVRREDGG